MGFLRYFLAIVVVISHSPYINLIPKPLYGNGGIAVAGFFVISGFYMALLVEKYQLNNRELSTLKNFYLSRLFRIYPLYYVCLLITLILYSSKVITLPHPPIAILASFNSLFDKALYLFSNLFIFGQSLIRFFIYDTQTGGLIFHPTHNLNVPPAELGSSYELLGQAWSLSLELTFYFLVPFILMKSKKFLISLCVGSFLLRTILMCIDKKSLVASDIFFPLTIGIFLLGSLSYQIIYKQIKNKFANYQTKLTATALVIILILFALFANLSHNSDNYTAQFYIAWWTFLILVAVTIPYLFLYSKNWRFDQLVGELSYPIYMTHLFCLEIMTRFTHSIYTAYYTIVLATAVSFILVYVVVKPLDNYRHKQFLKTAPQTLPRYSDAIPVTQPSS